MQLICGEQVPLNSGLPQQIECETDYFTTELVLSTYYKFKYMLPTSIPQSSIYPESQKSNFAGPVFVGQWEDAFLFLWLLRLMLCV